MKIKIDFDNRIISIEDRVNLGELNNRLETLFPNGEWKKFSLESTVYTYYTNPIVGPIKPYWEYPWYQPSEITNIGYQTDGSTVNINQCFGTYSVEL